jgi:hypothetical protein
MPAFAKEGRDAFHRELLATCLTIDAKHICSNADRDNKLSVRLSCALSERLPGELRVARRKPRQQIFKQFQSAVRNYLREILNQMPQPSFKWSILGVDTGVAAQEQYSHLTEWDSLVKKHPDLKATLRDLLILPDVFLSRSLGTRIRPHRPSKTDAVSARADHRRSEANSRQLQGSISCKWTLHREALNLALPHKGMIPHIVVVTGETLPSRLASLAIGACNIDKVYHFALPELVDAAKRLHLPDALDAINMLIEGNRLGDIAELPLDLVN